MTRRDPLYNLIFVLNIETKGTNKTTDFKLSFLFFYMLIDKKSDVIKIE